MPPANRGFVSFRGWRSLRPNSATPPFSSPPSLSLRSHSVYALWVKFEGPRGNFQSMLGAYRSEDKARALGQKLSQKVNGKHLPTPSYSTKGAFTAIYGPEPPPSRVEYNIEKITTSFKMDKYYKVENMNSEPMYFSTEAQADKSVIGPYGCKRSLLVIE